MELIVALVVGYFIICSIIGALGTVNVALYKTMDYTKSSNGKQDMSFFAVICLVIMFFCGAALYSQGNNLAAFQSIFVILLTVVGIYYTFKLCVKLEKWYERK